MSPVLIDNYDSFTYNLAHLIAKANNKKLPLVIRNDEKSVAEILAVKPSHVFISPGPSHPKNSGICRDLVLSLIEANIPIFGVCLGFQVVIDALSGTIIESNNPKHGIIDYIEHDGTGIFDKIISPLKIVRYHSLIAKEDRFPDCLQIDSRSTDKVIMSFKHKTKPVYGVLFHPESFESESGEQLIANFFKLTNKMTT